MDEVKGAWAAGRVARGGVAVGAVRDGNVVDAGANFDRIARAYRWMEYAALGTLLERVRWWFLDAGALDECKRALVLGDGDGRFTARMVRRCGEMEVTAVDASFGMLRLLRARCAGEERRLKTVHGDARTVDLQSGADLVVTHFFLDCLSQAEAEEVVRRVGRTVRPGALWLVSEFAIPEGWRRWPAQVYVRGLYGAFRVLTGLRVDRLPDYGAALLGMGFEVAAEREFAGGLLVTQVWRLTGSL